ncbi:AMP-binding protein [Pararhizobium sp. PWRC1-1]|uniref:AMP-binding protein n=1 Tax=Pararhizobium sp. PWRC1-1 TaxID=2804566 RepID=UPI003CF8DB9C
MTMILQEPRFLNIPGMRDDDIERRTLPDILRHQAERLGNKPFIDICGRSAGFEDMLHVSLQLAGGLHTLGVEKSDRVAMLLPNCFELVATWFAVSHLGAIEVPNNPGLKGDLLCHNLNNSGAEVLIADAAALPELSKVQANLPALRTLILVGTDAAEARAAGVRIDRIVRFDECLAPRADFQCADVHYADPMAILYTSGTTGPAKGALMSHHHCYSWAAAMEANLGYTSDDSYFSALPLFHTDAQMFGVYLPLIYGTKATIVDGFSASKFWDQVRASGATATNLLGAMAVILMRAPPADDDADNPVRVCQCIPMVPDKQAFERRFNMQLVTGYGQTETSFVTLDTVEETRHGSCGRAHPDWEVAIVDERDQLLPPGTLGEIVSRPRKSWSMFSGYYRAEAKTVETLRNLWYHSGDAGVMDADGWLYFKSRMNEAIRRRGENISAYEIETVAESHPDIVECAAFGIPSAFTEEDIMIVAMRRNGSALTPGDLIEHFQTSAPRHMVPRYIDITDMSLPRTPTEKIARNVLRNKGVSEATFDRGDR